jgi:hypothetical protein
MGGAEQLRCLLSGRGAPGSGAGSGGARSEESGLGPGSGCPHAQLAGTPEERLAALRRLVLWNGVP